MKTSLKRAEIIEKLKKYFNASSLAIIRQTTLDFSSFHRCHVLIVKYNDNYQLVSLYLRYGWVEIVFGESEKSFQLVFQRYLTEISRICCDVFDDVVNDEL